MLLTFSVAAHRSAILVSLFVSDEAIGVLVLFLQVSRLLTLPPCPGCSSFAVCLFTFD